MISAGLTGNLGSGKSTVARLLAELGAEVVDADLLVHELLAPGGAAVAPVLAAFPQAAAPDGRGVDRARLGSIVFASRARRRELERILHPLVAELDRRRIADAEARGVPLVVTEATLLFEAQDAGTAPPDSLSRFDVIVAVTCAPEVRLARAVARSPLSRPEAEADAKRRLAAQMPQEEKARRADLVVDNSGTLEDLRREVRVLHSRLLRAAPRRSP